MVDENRHTGTRDLTSAERARLLDQMKRTFTSREEIRRRTGNVDVAALLQRARGTERPSAR